MYVCLCKCRCIFEEEDIKAVEQTSLALVPNQLLNKVSQLSPAHRHKSANIPGFRGHTIQNHSTNHDCGWNYTPVTCQAILAARR